ncbi:MAG: DUF3105 domain-containing protein [Chloroflexota bacterium]|nr:DUF3105 domain-containing protein [Chloroflexota bacterium]
MSETRAVQRPASGGAAARRELRRQQTEAQQQARRRAETAAQRRRWLIWGAGIGTLVVALGLLIYWLARPEPGPQAQILPIQGRVHIARGATHPAYNSTPPTSGWHYADAVAPPGISAQQIPDEVQVHNLEHGEIMIQYSCPQGCPEMVSALEAIVRTYPKKVVLAPYAGLSSPIALTSWGKLVYLDQVDEAYIRRYIATNKDKGPEVFPD